MKDNGITEFGDSETDKNKPTYVTPTVSVLNEEEALSAFQVTAAGSGMWWV